jgi:hypothetical protein
MEAAVALFHSEGNFFEGLRKATKLLNQDGRMMAEVDSQNTKNQYNCVYWIVNVTKD